ncbi:hypothetical protein [Kitasatospora sp. GP82]|uniref:hypothetical protein n=1 Tax=Kitasatospora sp. GP82 TaxID=3035089 RepID=UPI00247380E2|nr:hypothetical protein [Kitasatospora sp. GP82]MDH6129624.1 hypothetical protein [Kitasatospora sp. GP82]
MPLPARLLASARVPGLTGEQGAEAIRLWPEQRRLGVVTDSRLSVFALDELLAGGTEPVAVFAAPWNGWERENVSVSADGSFAVFAGPSFLHAVERDGRVRWRYHHTCWGHHHYSSHDETRICDGVSCGSCWIAGDGSVVWAHVPAADGEQWLVLDAVDGKLLGAAELDSATSGSLHVPHPDGRRVGLDVGMGQDGALVYWGRWDGHELEVRESGYGEDRILTEVHPDGRMYLTTEHGQRDLAVHSFGTDETLAGCPADVIPLGDDYAEQYWDHQCGYLDPQTVLASTVEADEDYGPVRHWLLSATTLELLGAVGYPTQVEGEPTPLGDGTWLTRSPSGTVTLWSLAP